jgi:toxoflavin biosynthesis protein ToxD
VRREVNAAINEQTAGRMLGVLPLVLQPCVEQDIPMLWRPLHRYDATQDATAAIAKLLGALGLAARGGQLPHSVAASAAVMAPAALPGSPRPLLKSLYDLGLAVREINGIEIILPPLCSVPAGPFTMGSDKARDSQASDDETPQYMIEVGAFQIGKYPITVAEYACAVRAKGVREPPPGSLQSITWADQLKRLDHPVICVSWHDVVAYAVWLAQVTGRPWRLPSEAEWEKAARGTDGRIYPWGDAFDKARCNTDASKIGATTRVGSYPMGASPYGAQDMAGNVWEWISSRLRPYPYRQNDGREYQDSPGNCGLRGGSWFAPPQVARTAQRLGGFGAVDLNESFGFRLVCAAPGSA